MLATLLLAPAPSSAMLRCKELVVDNYKFDFGELAGPHTVTTSEFHPPTYTNTTYTLDLCAFLKRKGDVRKDEDCPNGTRGKSWLHTAAFLGPFPTRPSRTTIKLPHIPSAAKSLFSTPENSTLLL